MIIGIDEVGRGCWAGPLVAAAVKLGPSEAIEGVTDSKALSAKRRQLLCNAIKTKASDIGIGWVWPTEINKIGLTESVRLAMQRAVAEIEISAKDQVVIDGNIDYLALPNSQAVIKADGSVTAVSAASIIAKVARDEYMQELAEKYPDYGFERHVGYGTAQHTLALKTHGVISEVHRLNYRPIKVLLA